MAVAGRQHGLHPTYTTGTVALGTGFVVLGFLIIRAFLGLGFSPAAVLLCRIGFSFLFSQLAVCKPCRELMAKFTLSLSLLCFCSLFLDVLGA